MEEKRETHFVGVRFPGSDKSYYYSTKFADLIVGDVVIVDSDGVLETATVSTTVKSMENYAAGVELKAILRKATAEDLRTRAKNEIKAKTMMGIAQQEANRSNLPMDFIASYLSFGGDVITLVYTSTEKRVDFRDLLPILGSKLKARVSLRQIASRDRAKMIGGIGICGLPLCCSTFLTNFETISISKMKNQMLAINIPKYSGPCEKLMCCLAYEDELYATEKAKFPRINQEVKYQGETYTVNSFNILSRTVRLSNADHTDFQNFALEDVLAMIDGTYKPQEKVIVTEKEYSLPDYRIPSAREESDYGNEREKAGKNERNNRESQGKNQKPQRNGNQPQRSERNENNGGQKDQRRDNRNDRRDNNRGSNDRRDRRDNQQQRQGQQGNAQNGEKRQQNQNNQQQRHNHGNRPNNNQQQRNKERPAGQNGDAANRPDNGENNPNRNNRRRYHHHHHNGNKNGGGNRSGGEGA